MLSPTILKPFHSVTTITHFRVSSVSVVLSEDNGCNVELNAISFSLSDCESSKCVLLSDGLQTGNCEKLGAAGEEQVPSVSYLIASVFSLIYNRISPFGYESFPHHLQHCHLLSQKTRCHQWLMQASSAH